MTNKTVFVRVRTNALLARARRAGFTDLLVPPSLAKATNGDQPYVEEGDRVTRDGHLVGRHVVIRGPRDERALRRRKGEDGWVFVETPDWRVIPLENLIASFQGKPRVAAVAHSPEEARLFLETLERGVDAVVVDAADAKHLRAYRDLLAARPARLALETWKVTRVVPVSAGERVCVDTVHLLAANEGLLVGSGAHALFLIASEARPGRYVGARPFRVNAGALHSYVWAGDRTHYLSEAEAGVRLQAVDPRGAHRPVTVGRAKIETRPLLLVEAQGPSGRGNVVVQNAETVRLVQPGGRTKPVGRLRKGDAVLVHPETGARHFGLPIEERIVER